MRARTVALTVGIATLGAVASPARAGGPDGVALVRGLGAHADLALGTNVAGASGLVRLPPGARAKDLGLDEIGPGLGAVRGGSAGILRFGAAHPGLRVEVAPPLHILMDRAGEVVRAPLARATGADGAGALVGIADTGIDITHKDLQDDGGKTRIAWLLDLSLKPVGLFPELEDRFGIKDENGALIAGAVFDAPALDDLVRRGRRTPTDELGHGTHVTSLAAGSGGGGMKYVGVAPKAGIVFARVVRAGAESISNDDLLRGAEFMFERADTMKLPIAVNLSVGTDFGPHDGTMTWEQQLVTHIGPGKPGHAMVVAAGNSGAVTDTPVHQTVFVAPTARSRVPFVARGGNGSLQVWIAARPGAQVRVGLDGPDREWIPPVPFGSTGGYPGSDAGAPGYDSAVIHGDSDKEDVIPAGSRSAVVVISGAPPKGTYHVTLVGEGTVDLWYQGSGSAGGGSAGFSDGVREGTVNLPAAHPDILAVGCTVNHATWTSVTGGVVSLNAPLLDRRGHPVPGALGRRPAEGEPCWFSSAGPNLNGVAKPEIAAPGGGVIGAMSKQALADAPGSIFYDPGCPKVCAEGKCNPDTRCRQIDATHAVALGTSMSSPVVAGVAALLFQRDPTLTQHEIVALLQAGAHRFLAPAPFDDQSGPGEVDVPGALDALERARTPVERMPSKGESWLTLSTPHAPADGASPVLAIVELRTADKRLADVFDRNRVRAEASIGGRPLEPAPVIERKQAGLWTYRLVVPKGNGGRALRLSATFDGVDIVEPKTIPIAVDSWAADLAPRVRGGKCDAGAAPGAGGILGGVVAAVALVLARLRRRAR